MISDFLTSMHTNYNKIYNVNIIYLNQVRGFIRDF